MFCCYFKNSGAPKDEKLFSMLFGKKIDSPPPPHPPPKIAKQGRCSVGARRAIVSHQCGSGFKIPASTQYVG